MNLDVYVPVCVRVTMCVRVILRVSGPAYVRLNVCNHLIFLCTCDCSGGSAIRDTRQL